MLKLSQPSVPKLAGDPKGEESHAPKKSVRPGKVADNLSHRRRAAKRILIDGRHERNAVEHILKLPEADENVHLVIDGRWKAFDLVPAIHRLAQPARIARLDISTLAFNVTEIWRITNAMDAGMIGHVLLICSHYFARSEKPAYEYLKNEIGGRGGTVAALRTHAKVILLEMTDGRHFVIEGSGNLRSCRSVEQFCISQSKELLLFHREWMESFIETSKPK